MSDENKLTLQRAAAFASGLLFAVGLVFAGMTQPGKVIGFFDFGWSHEGSWDPSLAFVMGFGVLVYAPAYRIAKGRNAPLFDTRFRLPTRRDVDARLLGGAAIFGIGWGLGGYCPGPAMTSLGTFGASAGVFVVSMFAGMFAFSYFEKLRTRRQAAAIEASPPPATQPQEASPASSTP